MFPRRRYYIEFHHPPRPAEKRLQFYFWVASASQFFFPQTGSRNPITKIFSFDAAIGLNRQLCDNLAGIHKRRQHIIIHCCASHTQMSISRPTKSPSFSIDCPVRKKKGLNNRSDRYKPEIGARVNNPVSCGLLSNALLHEGLLAAKEFHGQLVVRRLEEGLQLVADERRLGLAIIAQFMAAAVET